MKKFTIFIIALISTCIIVVIASNILIRDAGNVLNKSLDKKTYQMNLLKLNSTINQAMVMSRTKGINLCTASPQNISSFFKESTRATGAISPGSPEFKMPRKYYKNENSSTNLNLSSAIKFYDGSVVGFKKPSILNNNCFDIYVDFNGNKAPNMIGIDTHMLSVSQSGVRYGGLDGQLTCKENSNSLKTSLGCTYLMIKNPKLMP